MKIFSRYTKEVIYEADLPTISEVVEKAVSEGANLEGAYLRGANLRGANLEGAYLRGAYLRGAYLEGANLEGAYLRGAYLEGANLEGANLEGAYLEGAYLRGANLRGAYLEEAKNILLFKANSSGRMFYIVNGDEIKVQAGCFWGTIKELKDKIAKQHSEDTHWDYLMACDWAERLWEKEAGE